MVKRRRIPNHKRITSDDIVKRHPRHLFCSTDKIYADLAFEISHILERMNLLDEKQLKNVSISLALYFEDIHSKTRQFETFTRLYKRMYGLYVPFFFSKDASEPEARLDAMKFILWHCICAERDGDIINPTNEGLVRIACELLELWDSEKANIPSNEELADHLFSEETLEDPDEVKLVLIWLSRKSYLGRWYNNPTVDDMPSFIKDIYSAADKDELDYICECLSLSFVRVWPLSLNPWHIYAEMIRIDMDDPDDEMAAMIDNIEVKALSFYKLKEIHRAIMLVEDVQGGKLKVNSLNFADGNLRKVIRSGYCVYASFIFINGQWWLNGTSSWVKISDEEFLKEQEKHKASPVDNKAIMEYIERNDGERLYFFPNMDAMKKWMEKDFGIKKITNDGQDLPANLPVSAFIEENGKLTCSYRIECIKHSQNPSYNRFQAKEMALGVIFTPIYCSQGMLTYMLERHLLPDAALVDFRGDDHGRALVQDNIDFLSRCMRRDINSDKVACPRPATPSVTTREVKESDYYQKFTFSDFVEAIAGEEIIYSSHNKEWEVVKADKQITVVRDVRNNVEHTMLTSALYRAHMSLAPLEIKVKTLEEFVDKKDAPAAAALLYNIVGKGRGFNHLRKLFEDFFKRRK